MIDLHLHILPGIDDGARNLGESMAMARQYIKAGFKQVVATPHCVPGTVTMLLPEKVRQTAEEFRGALDTAGIPLEVFTGMEVAMEVDLNNHINEGRILTLADTNYLLLEPPFTGLPLNWQQIIFQIQSAGCQVLLAHPERCAQLAVEPEINRKLIDMGVYFQLTWGSFAGQFGAPVKRQAHFLAQKGWVHCLATDSHNPGARGPESAVRQLDEMTAFFGSDNLALLSLENPARVLNSSSLHNPEPLQRGGKRRKWWSWSRKAS